MTEAPIWRLRNSHYLNVPGTEWEHTETSRETGKRNRKMFAVPALLNPNDPSDCDRNGDCLVYRLDEGSEVPRAARFGGHHQFLGDPTPDMEPMNEEAEAISATFADRWKHPIDSLAPDFSQSLLSTFEAQLSAVVAKAGGFPAANTVVPDDEVSKLKAEMAELRALLATQSVPIEPAPATTVRR